MPFLLRLACYNHAFLFLFKNNCQGNEIVEQVIKAQLCEKRHSCKILRRFHALKRGLGHNLVHAVKTCDQVLNLVSGIFSQAWKGFSQSPTLSPICRHLPCPALPFPPLNYRPSPSLPSTSLLPLPYLHSPPLPSPPLPLLSPFLVLTKWSSPFLFLYLVPITLQWKPVTAWPQKLDFFDDLYAAPVRIAASC